MRNIARSITKYGLLATAYIAIVGVVPAFAASNNLVNVQPVAGTTNLSTPSLAKTWLNETVGRVLGVVGLVVGIVALIYLIWSGFQYLTAGGDTKKADAARQGILNAIIGIIIIMSAYLILNFATGAGSIISNQVDNASSIQ